MVAYGNGKELVDHASELRRQIEKAEGLLAVHGGLRVETNATVYMLTALRLITIVGIGYSCSSVRCEEWML
jgi:hypothetical protein